MNCSIGTGRGVSPVASSSTMLNRALPRLAPFRPLVRAPGQGKHVAMSSAVAPSETAAAPAPAAEGQAQAGQKVDQR